MIVLRIRTNISAPPARNGPKGIFVERLCVANNNPMMPIIDPIIDPISKLNHEPINPVKDPMNARSSISPWPSPSFFVRRKKVFDTINKKKALKNDPMTLSVSVRGSL